MQSTTRAIVFATPRAFAAAVLATFVLAPCGALAQSAASEVDAASTVADTSAAPTTCTYPATVLCGLNCTNPSVVMCGLDNPRGLGFDEAGALYVAEAGRGNAGADPVTLRDDAHPDQALPRNCVNAGEAHSCGPTGAISRWWNGVQERFATGMPSGLSLQFGNSRLGPNAVSWLEVGRPSRRGAYVPIGLWDDPNLRATANYPALGAGFGQVARVRTSGEWEYVFDMAAYVATLPCDDGSPAWCDEKEVDRGFPDSNPYAILARPDHLVALDASANALLRVNNAGKPSLLATFPLVPKPPVTACVSNAVDPADSVPTTVVRGPDEAYYVGEHTGNPFYAGNAKVYRVVPGEQPTVFLSGFTTINGIAFDATGENLYVLQFFSPLVCGYNPGGSGKIIRVHHPHQLDETRTAFVTGLMKPTALTVGPDGAIYVSNKGTPNPTTRTVNGQTKTTVIIGTGEVLRFEVAP